MYLIVPFNHMYFLKKKRAQQLKSLYMYFNFFIKKMMVLTGI